MAKGHIKRPRHGIRSTRRGTNIVPTGTHIELEPIPVIVPVAHAPPVYPSVPVGPHIIADDDTQSIANIFCFGAFADKQSGIVYHDLTGSFPFMSFDGSVCFFVLYHYESNAILAKPIAGLDDMSIFRAYQMYLLSWNKRGSNQN